jgi:hypothetical protein
VGAGCLITFCAACVDWRRTWHGIALMALGGITFCCSLGAIVLLAGHP